MTIDKFHILPGTTLTATAAPSAKKSGRTTQGGGVAFDALLADQIKTSPLKFSRHAQSRMQSRGIEFSAEQMGRMETAVSRVGAKGGRESLVMLDETALVVSISKKTVVTVVDQNNLKDNVFTNIDSAVIA